MPTAVRDAELFTRRARRGRRHVHDRRRASASPRASATTRSRPTGPYHVARIDGLEPDTEYELAVDGVDADRLAAGRRSRTLAQPPGALLATFATVNDVHFGETECGRIGDRDRRDRPDLRAPSRASRRIPR